MRSLSKTFSKVILVGTKVIITKQATASFMVEIKDNENSTKAFGKTITSALIQAGKNLGRISEKED